MAITKDESKPLPDNIPQISLLSPRPVHLSDQNCLTLPVPKHTTTTNLALREVWKGCEDLSDNSIPSKNTKLLAGRDRALRRSPKSNNYCSKKEKEQSNEIYTISSVVENHDKSSNSDQEGSLPSGLSWSSAENDPQPCKTKEDQGSSTPGNTAPDQQPRRLLSPRMLLALLSPIQSERAPSRDSRTTSRMSNRSEGKNSRCFTPQEVKVAIGGRENSITQILHLTPRKGRKTYMSPLDGTPRPISRLCPSNSASRQAGTMVTSFSQRPFNITITPPVLPLCFANALLTLYAVNEPGVDCKLHLLGKIVQTLLLHKGIIGNFALVNYVQNSLFNKI